MASSITAPIASTGTTHHFALPPATTISGNRNPTYFVPFITRASAPRLAEPAMVRDFSPAHLANAKETIATSLVRGGAVVACFLHVMKLEVAKMGDRLDDAIEAEEAKSQVSEHLQDFFHWDYQVMQSESTASASDTQMGGQTLPDDDDNENNNSPAYLLEESLTLRQKVRAYCRDVECVLHQGKFWTGCECPEARVFGPNRMAFFNPHPSIFLDELREEKMQWEILWQGCWIAWERFLHLHGRMTTLAKVWRIDENQAGTA